MSVGIRGLHDERVQNVDGADEPSPWGAERHDGELIHGDPEQIALPGNDTDHPVRKAADHYLLVDGIDPLEELVGQLLADDYDRLRGPDLLGGKRAPRHNLIVADLEVALFRPRQSDAFGNLAAVVDRHIILAELREGGGGADPIPHVIGIVVADPGPAPPRQPDLIGNVAGHDAGPLPQLEGVGPHEGVGELFHHVPVHALHDRHYCDEKSDADEHPDEGEETLQLLRAKSGEGHPHRFQQPHQEGVASRVLVVSAGRTLAPSLRSRMAW